MAYMRTPNTVVAGVGLTQTPPPTDLNPAGAVPVLLEALPATTSSLGSVQVGSGLSVSPVGVLSTIGNSSLLNVYTTEVNYTADNTNCYINVIEDDVIITLPSGVTGKVFIVKNQSNRGNITVRGTGGQTLDNSVTKILGNHASLIAVFDGTRWGLV